ncbi:MAG: thiolase family protein, partial [Planctomycetales bacterium]
GVDSMSNIPVCWSKSLAEKLWNMTKAKGYLAKLAAGLAFRPKDFRPRIGIQLGLTDPVVDMMMGDTAEVLARELNISREEQDAFAMQSHQRAAAAWESGRLQDETMTVYPENEDPITEDDGVRADQNMKALGKLKPYFDRKWGSITIGNSCQVTDGAAAVLVMDSDLAAEHGLEPLGRIRSFAYAGCDPKRMGLGPVRASAEALAESGLRLGEMDIIEINEAFAAQALACVRAFDAPPKDCDVDRLGEVDEKKLNVNGGAIALGHPVGATGARLVLTTLRELKRRDQQFGLATLCVGGGQGGAVVLERGGRAA